MRRKNELIGEEPLLHAAKNDNNILLNAFLQNSLGSVSACDENGRTALSLFVSHGNVKATEKLLDVGADPNSKDNSGKTPLHYSIIDSKSPDRTSFNMLASKGGDAGIKDHSGKTPLDYTKRAEDMRNESDVESRARQSRLQLLVSHLNNRGRSFNFTESSSLLGIVLPRGIIQLIRRDERNNITFHHTISDTSVQAVGRTFSRTAYTNAISNL